MVRRSRHNLANWFLRPFLSQRGLGHQPDLLMLAIIGILLFLGLLFLSSASSTLAFYQYHDTYRFVKQQILHGLLPGLVLFYLALRIDYQVYKRFYRLFLILSLILLILVIGSNFGNQYGTAQSWIVFGNISFQPSELVKLLFILFLAGWLDNKQTEVATRKIAWTFLIIVGIISVLIIKQPDFGTLSIILAVALSMYFVAGANWRHLLTMVAAGAIAFAAMIKMAPYRMNRFVAWLNPDFDPRGIGWQIKQSLIAIGSGGLFGVGLGMSKQKSYVPMPANDSIFAIIAEEVGFIFTTGLIVLFMILLWRGFLLVKQAPDNFSKLTALGIVIWLLAQVFINIAGMMQLLPLTGVPLPLISLGGSNLTVTLLSLGILANISKFTNR
ncbi:MAG: putative peptidoglycan glycosyltransferase FtsW [Patescibacteria group bacterium]